MSKGIITETYFDLTDAEFVFLAEAPDVELLAHDEQVDDRTGQVIHSLTLARNGPGETRH